MIDEDLEPLDIELGDPSFRRRTHHKMNRMAPRKVMNAVEVSILGLIVVIIILVVIITLAGAIQG